MKLLGFLCTWNILCPTFSHATIIDLGQFLRPTIALIGSSNGKTSPVRISEADLVEIGLLSQRYAEALSKIRPGDTIEFSDGRKVTVVAHLGSGNSASVWLTNEGLALRIPLASEESTLLRSLQYAKSFAQGWRKMRTLTSHVIDYYSPLDNPEYALVENVRDSKNPRGFTFEDFWDHYRESGQQLSEYKGYSTKSLLNALDDLASDLAMVVLLEEGLQLIWTGASWKFHDFSIGIHLIDDDDSGPFAHESIWNAYRFEREVVDIIPTSKNGRVSQIPHHSVVTYHPVVLKRLILKTMRIRNSLRCPTHLTKMNIH